MHDNYGIPITNTSTPIAPISTDQSSSLVLPPEVRSEQQQVSDAPPTLRKEPPAEIVYPKLPPFREVLRGEHFISIDLLKFRLMLVLDLTQTWTEAEDIKPHLTAFAGRGETVSLFNPFRRKVMRKGKVTHYPGYLRDALLDIISNFAHATEYSPYVYAAESATLEQVSRKYLDYVRAFIEARINYAVDLNALIYSRENGDAIRLNDLVTVSSWLNREEADEEEGVGVDQYNLTACLRVYVPEVVAKKTPEGMIDFLDNMEIALINMLEDSGVSEADVVLAVATNTSAFFSNPAMAEFVTDLVMASNKEEDEDDDEEADEDNDTESEEDDLPDSDSVFQGTWSGCSVSDLVNAVDNNEDTGLFPNDSPTLIRALGHKAEMVFTSYIPYVMEDEDEDEDEDEEEVEVEEPAEGVARKRSSSTSKISAKQEIDDLVNRMASGDSESDEDVDKLIAALERDIDDSADNEDLDEEGEEGDDDGEEGDEVSEDTDVDDEQADDEESDYSDDDSDVDDIAPAPAVLPRTNFPPRPKMPAVPHRPQTGANPTIRR